ncbi:putative nucleotide-binding alpha-beta plait domain superfamily, RNA-binding domain superfamily [Helianthus anomalus]
MSGDSRRQEWQEATSRKNNRNSHSDATNNKVITKFFVSDLPPKCSSLDLKEVFGGFGGTRDHILLGNLIDGGKGFGFFRLRMSMM